MQISAASCACSVMATESEDLASFMQDGADHLPMTGCEGMEMGQPSFCHAHAFGDATKQSLDKAELPQVTPFVPAALLLTLQVADVAIGTTETPRPSIILTRTTAPPIAIRHCCFRI